MSEILVPDLGESISEGTIYKWLVKEGDTVGQGDVLAELETDKVNLEISAEVEGVISTILRQAGENVAVGEAIGIIGAASGSTPRLAASEAEAPKAAPAGGNAVAAAAPVAAPEVPAAGGDSHAALASPGARKLARERGIDLGEVSARDPIGRIGQAVCPVMVQQRRRRCTGSSGAARQAGASEAGSGQSHAGRGQKRGAQAHVTQTAHDCQPLGRSAADRGHAYHLQRGGHDSDPRHPQAPQGCI